MRNNEDIISDSTKIDKKNVISLFLSENFIERSNNLHCFLDPCFVVLNLKTRRMPLLRKIYDTSQ